MEKGERDEGMLYCLSGCLRQEAQVMLLLALLYQAFSLFDSGDSLAKASSHLTLWHLLESKFFLSVSECVVKEIVADEQLE